MKPLIAADPVYEKQCADFRGYYNEPFGSVARFRDMRNMSGDDAPIIRTRDARCLRAEVSDLNGVFARGNKLGWVSANKLYFDGSLVGNLASLSDGTARTFTNMGAYTIILPDKMIFDSMSNSIKAMDYETVTGYMTTVTPCDINGASVSYETATYAKVTPGPDMDLSGFKAGDVVEFECGGDMKGYHQLEKVAATALSPYIIVVHAFHAATEYINEWLDASTILKIRRKAPTIDYMTENNNRLFACSSANHEIYACKLGDPTNWRVYQGLSTDSWAVTVGGDGAFTGAATHMGYPLFFKQNEIIKIYGDKPANFQTSTVQARGVDPGCAGTLCTVNENLYYVSQGSMVRYSGAWPEVVSSAWGSEKMSQGVSGAAFGKVWTSVYSPARDAYVLMNFDTRTGYWHLEEEARIKWFAKTEGALYAAAGGGNIVKIAGDDGTVYTDSAVEDLSALEAWAMTGDLEMAVLDQLRVQKIMARVIVSPGAVCELKATWDNTADAADECDWETVARWDASGANYARTAYIVPRRCDHFRLMLWCRGPVRIMNLNYLYKPSTDIRVK